MIERTKEGIKRARSMGKQIGHLKKDIDKKEVEKYLRKSVPKTIIAKNLDVSKTTLYKRLREWRL